ncbi:two-component system response regulator KdpE [Pantoea sp. RRHST58]|uniref:two-component system response regulator KdpE n=1 Tax=Pantoea sp. RRHST58 TaxID=3425183 RepID=UPI002880F4A6|nr:two-component system response regulator KdpE [Enterobacter sp. BRE11]
MATVLIVEDEKEIRRFVRLALEGETLKVFDADTLQRGLIEAATRKPDLVILDLGLPDGDGRDFIRELRQWSAVPVIVLSARVDEQDKIDALDVGADDYLTKPFGIGELLARVRVALRRHPGQQPEPVIRFADVCVDLAARRVVRADSEVHLTPIEFRLLGVLLSNIGKVLTQRQLLSQVWGPNAVEHSHYLRIYMAHLRQKLEADPAQPKHLLTETGIGYRFMP